MQNKVLICSPSTKRVTMLPFRLMSTQQAHKKYQPYFGLLDHMLKKGRNGKHKADIIQPSECNNYLSFQERHKMNFHNMTCQLKSSVKITYNIGISWPTVKTSIMSNIQTEITWAILKESKNLLVLSTATKRKHISSPSVKSIFGA